MNNNQVSFTSKIKFVDSAQFSMLKKKNYIGYRHNEPNILKAPEFYSTEIRTCTGGGLINPYSEAEGFHFWDDLTNKKKFSILIHSLFRFVKNPERGFLVGSKELAGSKYSIEQFQNFKKVFLEKVKNVTLFEKHRNTNSETNFHYNLDTDTWTICASFREPDSNKIKYVKNIKDLKSCYENISIADGDRLFIGKKEIKPADAPEIFRTSSLQQI